MAIGENNVCFATRLAEEHSWHVPKSSACSLNANCASLLGFPASSIILPTKRAAVTAKAERDRKLCSLLKPDYVGNFPSLTSSMCPQQGQTQV